MIIENNYFLISRLMIEKLNIYRFTLWLTLILRNYTHFQFMSVENSA